MAILSEVIVETLHEAGIETIFGIPGTQSLPLNEAIDAGEEIRFVMARHETAVTHQAWGYAETGGGVAATVVIPGPGDMNAMNGLKNARNDCTPMVHIAIETEAHLRGGDAIHETPPETYDTVVKENYTVQTPESAVAELKRLIAVSRTPPMGPVRIGIPKDMLSADVAITAADTYPTTGLTGVPAEAVERAVTVLESGTRPVIIAGGGVRSAGAESMLETLAEQLDAPVVPTYKGKGVFPEDHPLFAGILSVGTSANLEALLAESDTALVIGSDLDAVTTRGWSVDLPADLVHVTLEAEDIGRGYTPTVGIAADATTAIDALQRRLPASSEGSTGANRASQVREADASLMADVLATATPPITSARAEMALSTALPDDAIISVDAGGFRIWSLYAMEMTGDRQFVDTGSWATMGTGLPAAIGAQLANPDRTVVGLMGGGGLLMCMQELHTIATEDIPVLAVVLNNNDYATISAEATASFDFEEGVFGWPEAAIRFTDIATAMGVPATTAETPDAIQSAVERSLDAAGPRLIEIPTDPTEPQAKPLD